ncbi:MAG: TIM barrel protein, partial [Oscillospiraceae bacterium]
MTVIFGLDAYEYQCGRGVNIGDETAAAIGEQARQHGITMSLHSPYFINLSSAEPERIEKSIDYILGSCHAALKMGGKRVVVHCGGLSGQTREAAMSNTLSTLKKTLYAMAEQGYNDVRLCIETMGKVNVLGNAEEVLHICKSDERLLPCIDFGHLNARTNGGMSAKEDFVALFDVM